MAQNSEDHDFLLFQDRGSSKALARVFDKLAPRLLLIAGHFARDSAQAEDLVQATFLQAMRDAAQYDGKRPVAGWLAGILKHRALDLGRKQRRQATEAWQDLPDESHDPARLIADQDTYDRLVQAVEGLEAPYREVLLMRLVHGIDARSIAHTLGRPPGTVRMQLKRGLERLRKTLPGHARVLALFAAELPRDLSVIRETILQSASPHVAAAASGAATPLFLAPLLGLTIMKKAVLAGVLALLALIVVPTSFQEARSDAIALDRKEPEQTPLKSILAAMPDSLEIRQTLAPASEVEHQSTATEIEQVPEAPRSLLLADSSGLPVSQAKVWFFTDSEYLAKGKSDEQGLLDVPRSAENAHALVLHESYLAALGEAQDGRFVLQTGQVVSGRVLLGGASPNMRLLLTLRHSESLIQPSMAERLPGFLWILLKQADLTQGLKRFQTHRDGHFRFTGLPEDWSGQLYLPDTLRLIAKATEEAPANKRLDLAQPEQNLQLNCQRGPRIEGRVVTADGSQPVANARALPTSRAHSSGSVSYFGGGSAADNGQPNADNRGRFYLDWDVAEGEYNGLSISISNPDGKAEKQYELLLADMQVTPWGYDAGDLRVNSLTDISVRVQDTQGRPIQGARAFDVRAYRTLSEPTDANGHTKLYEINGSRTRFGAVAAGYKVLELPRQGAQELTFTLAKANGLQIRLEDKEGEPATGFILEVHSKQDLFHEGKGFPSIHLRHVGASAMAQAMIGTAGNRVTFKPTGPDNRVYQLYDFTPDVPFSLHAVDALGNILQTLPMSPMGPEEHRQATLQVHGRLRTVSGRVTDKTGKPLEARVTVVTTKNEKRFPCDREGLFQIPGVSTQELTIRLWMQGSDPWEKTLPIPEDGNLGDLVLSTASSEEDH